MFNITGSKGFQITFENGCTISVQFGPGNYCQNRDADFDAPKTAHHWKSKDAEVAIILPNGLFYKMDDYEDVAGWQGVDDVFKWMEFAKNIKV